MWEQEVLSYRDGWLLLPCQRQTLWLLYDSSQLSCGSGLTLSHLGLNENRKKRGGEREREGDREKRDGERGRGKMRDERDERHRERARQRERERERDRRERDSEKERQREERDNEAKQERNTLRNHFLAKGRLKASLVLLFVLLLVHLLVSGLFLCQTDTPLMSYSLNSWGLCREFYSGCYRGF